MSASQQDRYRPETRLVHSGTLRSQYGETSEALFLTQGYVYENSEQAERRFKNEEPGFQYSRFANPTVAMFEERMAAFEGAKPRATATGMVADALALTGQPRSGDHVIAQRRCSAQAAIVEDYLPRFGIADPGRRHRSRPRRDAVRPNTKTSSGDADQRRSRSSTSRRLPISRMKQARRS